MNPVIGATLLVCPDGALILPIEMQLLIPSPLNTSPHIPPKLLPQVAFASILPQKKQRVGIRLLFHLPKKEKQLHCPKILWVEVLNSVFIKKENG